MVSLNKREKIITEAQNDPELSVWLNFIFNQKVIDTNGSKYAHFPLISTINRNDKTTFKELIGNYERREVNEISEWQNDHSLIFLLLLGCKKFNIVSENLNEVIKFRNKSGDEDYSSINEVFSSIYRDEYEIFGKFGFIKITFNNLLGRDTIQLSGALTAYDYITNELKLSELTPFMKIICLRAYDLILFNREPKKYEEFESLLGEIEKFRNSLTIRQAIQLFWSMPYKWFLFMMGIILAVISYWLGT